LVFTQQAKNEQQQKEQAPSCGEIYAPAIC
jgi:hypothetical protein